MLKKINHVSTIAGFPNCAKWPHGSPGVRGVHEVIFETYNRFFGVDNNEKKKFLSVFNDSFETETR